MGKGVSMAVVKKAFDHGLIPGDELTIKGSRGHNGHYVMESASANVMVVRRLKWYEWTWRELKRRVTWWYVLVKRATLRITSWAPHD